MANYSDYIAGDAARSYNKIIRQDKEEDKLLKVDFKIPPVLVKIVRRGRLIYYELLSICLR